MVSTTVKRISTLIATGLVLVFVLGLANPFRLDLLDFGAGYHSGSLPYLLWG